MQRTNSPDRIGVDADQVYGKEKVSLNQNTVKSSWMPVKMTLHMPKTVFSDFKAECEARRLSHQGVLRDLAIAWLVANKPGLDKDEYMPRIQSEVSNMKQAMKDAQNRKMAKLSPRPANTRLIAERNKKINPNDKAILEKNPFNGWMIDDKKD